MSKTKKNQIKLSSVKNNKKKFSIIIAFIAVFGALGVYKLGSSNAISCTGQIFRSGSSGYCVKQIQILANYKLPTINGSRLSEDGIFGAKTKTGITTIQSKWSITQDGVVGYNTWKALCSPGTVSPNKGGSFSGASLQAYRAAGCGSITGQWL